MSTTTSSSSLSFTSSELTEEKESLTEQSVSTSTSSSVSPKSDTQSTDPSSNFTKDDNEFNSEYERNKLGDVIDIALLEVDYKTGKEVLNSNNKWTVHNTKDANVSVIYRKMDNDEMITMRSCMDIECNINDVYDFFDCEANDDLKLAIKNDKFMTSYKVTKVYNQNQCLVHTTFSTGAPKSVVKPRDFFYMKKRFKFNKYGKNGMNIHGILGYSLDESHSEYVPRMHKHVRGWINYTGVVVIEKSPKICTLCYVVCVDLCGKLPKKIVNICTPQQGMNIKKFAANIDEARAMLNRRKSTIA